MSPSAEAKASLRSLVEPRAAAPEQSVLVVEVRSGSASRRWRVHSAKQGLRVVATGSGSGALALVSEWDVSLILVSESLPGRSGIDLAREIQRTRPGFTRRDVDQPRRAQVFGGSPCGGCPRLRGEAPDRREPDALARRGRQAVPSSHAWLRSKRRAAASRDAPLLSPSQTARSRRAGPWQNSRLVSLSWERKRRAERPSAIRRRFGCARGVRSDRHKLVFGRRRVVHGSGQRSGARRAQDHARLGDPGRHEGLRLECLRRHRRPSASTSRSSTCCTSFAPIRIWC